MSQMTLVGRMVPQAGMPNGAPLEMTRKICAGSEPNWKNELLRAGPIPPPPLLMWQPTQLNLLKYSMPRCAELGSPAIGFCGIGPVDTAPGKLRTNGTLSR